jgi:hypothetical protein
VGHVGWPSAAGKPIEPAHAWEEREEAKASVKLNKLRRKACGEELTEEWRALTGGPGWRYAPNTWDPVAERLGLTCEVS